MSERAQRKLKPSLESLHRSFSRLSPGLLAITALFVAGGCIAIPFVAATFPKMVDLPMHAAQTAVLRYYFEGRPDIRAQFELHPLSNPYMSSYVLGALLMSVMPVLTAVRVATALMLCWVPGGVATLAWGMKRSPLIGLAAVPLVFCELASWGFINSLAAMGMLAAVIGLTLRLLDEPTKARCIALGLLLVLLFFTHIFRFPLALAGIFATTVVMTRDPRRWRPLLFPVAVALALLVVFMVFRPPSMQAEAPELKLHTERLPEILLDVAGREIDEKLAERLLDHAMLVLALASAAWGISHAKRREQSDDARSFARRSLVAVGASIALSAFAYLILPWRMGTWAYVYPREATMMTILALGMVPPLPREAWMRWVAVAALSVSSFRVVDRVALQYGAFDARLESFRIVAARIPPASKLCYLVFDREDPADIHVPAYVQAEKGGYLSFQFANFAHAPLHYRSDPEAVVPPIKPHLWEWNPEWFEVQRDGAFFDWFLIHSKRDPSDKLAADPTIVPVAHEGTWWLYVREGR
ncbi:MAG: hypothetical protein HOW73_07125 [Polyangiaceae bacterium]|nr:hypothetical protein [Polyangiaceae bacterium]